MKLPKVKISRIGENGWIEIVRSELPVGMISMKNDILINRLKRFVIATQKGERLISIQTKKYIERYSKKKSSQKLEYNLYLNAVEYCILELNRMIEVYHHEFISNIDEEFELDLLKSPPFNVIQKQLKVKGINITQIQGYECVMEIRKISNDLKHSYIQEYSLSKTLNLKSFRDFDRKIFVDKLNLYFDVVPRYILNLAELINIKYPKIERNVG